MREQCRLFRPAISNPIWEQRGIRLTQVATTCGGPPKRPLEDQRLTAPLAVPYGFQRGSESWGNLRQGHAECEADLLALPRSKHDLKAQFRSFQIGRTPRYCVDLSQPIPIWEHFIEDCRNRDAGMADWSESTVARLRSTVFVLAAERK